LQGSELQQAMNVLSQGLQTYRSMALKASR